MTKTASSVDHARNADIAQSIKSSFAAIVGTADDKAAIAAEAKEANESADGKFVNARESALANLADMAHHGGWTVPEIKLGMATAITLFSNASTPKAIATFKADAMAVMDPRVCSSLSSIIYKRDLAWDAEQAELAKDKAAPAPIRKAFKRKYHFLLSTIRAAKEGTYYTDVDALVAWAETLDPDLDVKKVHARLAAITASLSAFHADFPDADIEACIGFLNNVTMDNLAQAARIKAGEPEPTTAPVKSAIAASPAARAAAARVVVEAEPMPGCINIDDVLDGYTPAVATAVATSVALAATSYGTCAALAA